MLEVSAIVRMRRSLASLLLGKRIVLVGSSAIVAGSRWMVTMVVAAERTGIAVIRT